MREVVVSERVKEKLLSLPPQTRQAVVQSFETLENIEEVKVEQKALQKGIYGYSVCDYEVFFIKEMGEQGCSSLVIVDVATHQQMYLSLLALSQRNGDRGIPLEAVSDTSGIVSWLSKPLSLTPFINNIGKGLGSNNSMKVEVKADGVDVLLDRYFPRDMDKGPGFWVLTFLSAILILVGIRLYLGSNLSGFLAPSFMEQRG